MEDLKRQREATAAQAAAPPPSTITPVLGGRARGGHADIIAGRPRRHAPDDGARRVVADLHEMVVLDAGRRGRRRRRPRYRRRDRHVRQDAERHLPHGLWLHVLPPMMTMDRKRMLRGNVVGRLGLVGLGALALTAACTTKGEGLIRVNSGRAGAGSRSCRDRVARRPHGAGNGDGRLDGDAFAEARCARLAQRLGIRLCRRLRVRRERESGRFHAGRSRVVHCHRAAGRALVSHREDLLLAGGRPDAGTVQGDRRRRPRRVGHRWLDRRHRRKYRRQRGAASAGPASVGRRRIRRRHVGQRRLGGGPSGSGGFGGDRSAPTETAAPPGRPDAAERAAPAALRVLAYAAERAAVAGGSKGGTGGGTGSCGKRGVPSPSALSWAATRRSPPSRSTRAETP